MKNKIKKYAIITGVVATVTVVAKLVLDKLFIPEEYEEDEY